MVFFLFLEKISYIIINLTLETERLSYTFKPREKGFMLNLDLIYEGAKMRNCTFFFDIIIFLNDSVRPKRIRCVSQEVSYAKFMRKGRF